MKRLTDIVSGKVVEALETQLMAPERELMDWEVVPSVVPVGGDNILAVVVSLFYPAPGVAGDHICRMGAILDPYWPQDQVNRVVMNVVAEIRAEWQEINSKFAGRPGAQ
jgi:hypothetical protein